MSALKINCTDIDAAMNLLIPIILKDIDNNIAKKIVNSLWTSLQKGGELCKGDRDEYSKICKMISENSSLLHISDKEAQEANEVCSKLLNSCRSEFCGEGPASFNISCDDLKSLLKQASAKYATNLPVLCSSLQTMIGTKSIDDAIHGVIDFLKNFLKKSVTYKDNTLFKAIDHYIDKYNNQLKGLIMCLCPKLHDGSKGGITKDPCKESSRPVKINKFNWKAMLTTTSIIFVFFIIPILIVAFKGSWSIKKRIVIIGVMLITILILASILLLINPYGLIIPNIMSSDDWKNKDGKYRGKSEDILGMNISADIELKGNKVKLNTLSCTGSCPKNLLKNCKNLELHIDTTNKQQLGYPLCGDCLDEIKKTITGDSIELQGIFVVQKDGKMYVQVALKVNLLEPLVRVELNRYN